MIKGKNNGFGTGSHLSQKWLPVHGILNEPGAIFSEPGATFMKSNIAQYFKGGIRYNLLYVKDKYARV